MCVASRFTTRSTLLEGTILRHENSGLNASGPAQAPATCNHALDERLLLGADGVQLGAHPSRQLLEGLQIFTRDEDLSSDQAVLHSVPANVLLSGGCSRSRGAQRIPAIRLLLLCRGVRIPVPVACHVRCPSVHGSMKGMTVGWGCATSENASLSTTSRWPGAEGQRSHTAGRKLTLAMIRGRE